MKLNTHDSGDILCRALIAGRVLVQVQLVVLLCTPPLTRRHDLSRDRHLIPLVANLLSDILSNLLLFGTMCENNAAVLCADISALAVQSRGVVHAVEEFKDLAVRDEGGVISDLKGFGI